MTHESSNAIKCWCVASLLLFACQMDSLQVGSGKEHACCQGGQLRVETNVNSDEACYHTDIAVGRFLSARFSGGVCGRVLQQFGFATDAALS